ncbi:MAG TPA: hypothetical protein DDZ89_20690 [Clostridiales bacterium]|nr:hypothetical protein [Clostridiales bacterium]
MNSRELMLKTVGFKNPPGLAMTLPEEYRNDIFFWGPNPSPDKRCSKGTDEWGAVWDNIGVCSLGEVKKFPLLDWADFPKLHIPDVTEKRRWTGIEQAREKAGDRFLCGNGFSIYERLHFIRSLENTWIDIYENPEKLCELMDILTDMNLYAIRQYKENQFDGYMFCDDWGLQNSLMISPDHWRQFWKPRYKRIYDAAHKAGLVTILHSCGYIADILEDLIDAGLDVIQMDQQMNMGLDLLHERFAGRITFWCPVDIQAVMVYGNERTIRAYCREMTSKLGTSQGGFIARYYASPQSVGHTPQAIRVMCEEFMEIHGEIENGTFQYIEK